MKRLFRHLDEILMVLLIGTICLVLILQVFFRWVLQSPLIWSEELARYLFVCLTMLGLSYNVRKKNNISMELLYSKMPPKVQFVISCLTDILALALFGYMIPEMYQYTMSQAGVKSAAMRMPMVILAGSVLVGFILVIIQVIYSLYMRIRDSRRREEGTSA